MAVRVVPAGVLVIGGLAALGALSQLPYAAAGDDAIVRLAWRARSVRVEVCRQRSPEELSRLPVHMREAEVCEGRLLPYRLRAVVDNRPVTDAIIQPAGARADRPIYVFRELAMPAGEHRLSVLFERQGMVPAELPDDSPEEPGAARVAPPVLRLDTLVTLGPREVLLVTYDEESQRLLARRSVP